MSNQTVDKTHSPKNLITEDYEFQFCYDLGGMSDENVSEHDRWLRQRAAELTADSERGSHQCHHCGARFRYGAILIHWPTNTYIAAGETCLDNRFERTTAEFQAMRKKAELDRQAQRIRAEVAQNMIDLGFEDLDWMAIRNWEKRREAMPVDSRGNNFIQDVAAKLNRYGSINERQVAAVRKALARDAQWAADREAEAAEAIANPAQPLVTGEKLDLEGVIVSRKWKDSVYGGAFKLLIKLDNGSKVWGTEPNKIIDTKGNQLDQVEVGDTVTFRASKVEASDDDETFGFFKRPTRFQRTAVAA